MDNDTTTKTTNETRAINEWWSKHHTRSLDRLDEADKILADALTLAILTCSNENVAPMGYADALIGKINGYRTRWNGKA